MPDDTSTPGAPRPGANLFGAVIAVSGAVSMAASARSLHALAQTSHSSETLIIWVLLGLAVLGTVLCLHLALVWGLTVAVLLAGPTGRTGAALLGTLRLLAPRTARRITSGAAVATATTVLTLAPGMASEQHFGPDPANAGSSSSQSAARIWAEVPSADPPPEVAPAGTGGAESTDADAPLPPLGWGDGAAPGTSIAPTPVAADGSGSPAPASDSAPEPTRIVVVHQGDSLWSISDDLLGPGASDPAAIAALWPLLHETNRDVIGDDPDRLRPGQQLTVPADLTTQDIS